MCGANFFVSGFEHLAVGDPRKRTRNEDLVEERGNKAIEEFAGKVLCALTC